MLQLDKNSITLLIVDDEPAVTTSIAMLLKKQGYHALKAGTPQQALELLQQGNIDLVIQDMNFSRNTSGQEGMSLLKNIKSINQHIPVILMTAWGSIELAVEGIKCGARDFITKPWDNQQLLRTIETCLELTQTKSDQDSPLTRTELDQKYDFSAIVGQDPNMVKVLTTIGRVASTDAPILILGESGTGKELIADAVHQNSRRKDGPLIKVNLGGMNASLFESEMFGHVRGAFTDAKQDRKGRFEIADGGAIFLDEIGDLDPASQVKLLRVLQDRSFQPVGSSQSQKSNFRVISATNRNLDDMVKEGSFREDLLYRLNLICVELPPLRQRRGDIRLLAERHLRRIEQLYGLNSASIDESGLQWLEQQPWPGNIRQLTQTIERALLLSETSQLTTHHFEPQNLAGNLTDDSRIPVGSMTLDEIEKLTIQKTMATYQCNITKVAETLGISRAALYRRLEKYGLNE